MYTVVISSYLCGATGERVGDAQLNREQLRYSIDLSEPMYTLAQKSSTDYERQEGC